MGPVGRMGPSPTPAATCCRPTNTCRLRSTAGPVARPPSLDHPFHAEPRRAFPTGVHPVSVPGDVDRRLPARLDLSREPGLDVRDGAWGFGEGKGSEPQEIGHGPAAGPPVPAREAAVCQDPSAHGFDLTVERVHAQLVVGGADQEVALPYHLVLAVLGGTV